MLIMAIKGIYQESLSSSYIYHIAKTGKYCKTENASIERFSLKSTSAEIFDQLIKIQSFLLFPNDKIQHFL